MNRVNVGACRDFNTYTEPDRNNLQNLQRVAGVCVKNPDLTTRGNDCKGVRIGDVKRDNARFVFS